MLKARVITALALLLVFIPVIFFFPPVFFYICLACIMTLASWEWSRLLIPAQKSHQYIYAFLNFIFLFLMLGIQQDILRITFPINGLMISISGIFWCIFVPVVLKSSIHFPMIRFKKVFLLMGFIIFSSALIGAIELREFDLWFFLGVLSIVWCADIGAYFLGKKFGKNKLALNISPGKSWEGAIGGIVCVVLFVMLTLLFKGNVSLNTYWVYLLLGVGLACFSIMGDLFESLLKRLANVKDSSSLLPGHGGVLDRIDALLPVIPIAALFLKVLS